MTRLNKQTSTRILDNNVSSHEGTGYWHKDDYNRTQFYYADFNIKVRWSYAFQYKFSDAELTCINEAFFDAAQYELESLIDQIKETEHKVIEVSQTGRSGGWLTVKFHAPEAVLDQINLAYAVQRIGKLIESAVDYFSSVDYWRDYLEANNMPYHQRYDILHDPGNRLIFIQHGKYGAVSYDDLQFKARANDFWAAFNHVIQHAIKHDYSRIEVEWRLWPDQNINLVTSN